MVKTRERKPKLQVELTETDLPPGIEGRHKTVFNGSEVAHFWSSNKQDRGDAGNVFFRLGTIYSYGGHFPIARHVLVKKTKQKIILFTTRRYSNSTAKHLSHVRRAIPAAATVFYVPNVMADTRGEHLKNLHAYRDSALDYAQKSKRARGNKRYFNEVAMTTIEAGNAYAEAVGLRERLGSTESDDLQSWLQEAAAEIEAANAKQKAAERKRLRERIKVWEEKELPEWQEKLARWQAGENIPVPHRPRRPDFSSRFDDPDGDLCFVRVSRGKYLQTSLGMTVPIKEVMPVLEHIRSGAPYDATSSEGFKILDWEGVVNWEDRIFTAGCHRISFAEIERAAKAAGL